MSGARAPRWVAAAVAVGISVVALLGLTAAGAMVPAADHCASTATEACEPAVVSAQPAPQPPAGAGTRATAPCLHSVGCGGGGALALIGAGLALLLVAAPSAIPPQPRSQLVRPPKTARLPQLLLARDDGQPPRLAAVICA